MGVCFSCILCDSLLNWLNNALTLYQDNFYVMLLSTAVSGLLLFQFHASTVLLCDLTGDQNDGADEGTGPVDVGEGADGRDGIAASASALASDSASASASGSASGRAGFYDYGMRRGPHTWRTASNNQSPINIDIACVERNCFATPLMWVGYDQMPLGMRLENDGHTLLLRAAYRNAAPYIDGADLLSTFSFHEISFRWSWYNSTGSEHTVNNEHFPLEMQCLHTNALNANEASSRGILMMSYMFIVSEDNPFLDVIIQYLVAVQLAGTSVEIPPFPLSYLMSPFYSEFYSYHGSLTVPPCHRGAEWFLSPIPLAIGERQLHEFRKLRCRSGGRITRNARPVQELGDRTVLFNCYSASEN